MYERLGKHLVYLTDLIRSFLEIWLENTGLSLSSEETAFQNFALQEVEEYTFGNNNTLTKVMRRRDLFTLNGL